MGLTLITAPATEPITTAEAKRQCEVEHTDHDTFIGELIQEARAYFESSTRRALVTQTWDYTLEDFPVDAIELPMQPVQSVVSVSYVKPDGTTASFSDGASPETPYYDVYTDGPRTRIVPKYGRVWPETRGHPNAVTVRFIAGYETLPYDIRKCLKVLVAHYYENREDVVVGATVNPLPHSVTALMSAYQLRGF